MSTSVDIGRRVVGTEAQALGLLQEALDETFDAAVQILLNATGRIIVSGMGKSGHIARKIAATLASTGTPAHFVHPAEASHGDLGMMAQGDVTLVLSNSGETPELADLITYTRRFDIPMIGIASRPESHLLQQADVALVLPLAPEACTTGVVPTSSTTMTLALGDALAVALMEHRRFTPEMFRTFHPGGKLGAQLSLVDDLMHTGDALPLVNQSWTMSDVLLEISGKGFGVAGVIKDDGTLSGIITDGDLRRNMSGLLDRTAHDVMTADPQTIHQGTLAAEAVRIMNERKITCLFVMDHAQPRGLIHIHDCLRVGLG